MMNPAEDVDENNNNIPEINVNNNNNNDDNDRQVSGRDNSTSSSPKKVTKKSEESGCAIFLLSYQVFIILILLIALAFSYENTTKNFLKVVLVSFGIESLYFIVLLIAYCQTNQVSGSIIFIFSSVLVAIEIGFLVYVFYNDSNKGCEIYGCSVLTGTFIYRYIYLIVLLMFIVIHLIGLIGGLMNMIETSRKEKIRKRKVIVPKRRSRSQSSKKSKDSSRSTLSGSASFPSKPSSNVRIIRQRTIKAKYVPSETDCLSTTGSVTSFIPISQRDQSTSFVVCPVAKGYCDIPTCPFYNPKAHLLLQQQAKNVHEKATSSNVNNNESTNQQQQQVQQYQPQQQQRQQQQIQFPQQQGNRPLIVDLPADVVNNGGAVDVTHHNTNSQRIIIRMPGQNSNDSPPSNRDRQSSTYKTTVKRISPPE